MTKAPRTIDGTKQRHQNRQGANGVEAVGMRRQAAHGMESDRIAGDRFVLSPPTIGPRDWQLDLLIAGGDSHFIGEAANCFDRHAGHAARPLGCVAFDSILEQLKGRRHFGAIGQDEFA